MFLLSSLNSVLYYPPLFIERISGIWPLGPSGLVAMSIYGFLTKQVQVLLSCCLHQQIIQIILIKVESSREYWKFNQKESCGKITEWGCLSGVSLTLIIIQYLWKQAQCYVQLANSPLLCLPSASVLSAYNRRLQSGLHDICLYPMPSLSFVFTSPAYSNKFIGRSTVPKNIDMPRHLKTHWEAMTHPYQLSIKSLQTDLCYTFTLLTPILLPVCGFFSLISKQCKDSIRIHRLRAQSQETAPNSDANHKSRWSLGFPTNQIQIRGSQEVPITFSSDLINLLSGSQNSGKFLLTRLLAHYKTV